MTLAHEAERPPTFGIWFCDCHGCAIAAQTLARTDPSQRVVIKYGAAERRIFTIGEWAALTVEHGRLAADAVTGHGDYVHEVFLADDGRGPYEHEVRA